MIEKQNAVKSGDSLRVIGNGNTANGDYAL